MISSKSFWIAAKAATGFVIALAAFRLWGYSYGILTNEYHASIVLKLQDSALFRGDAMASTLGGYASPLWIAVGWLARWIPIQHLFLVGFIAARFLFAWSMGSLASSFTTDPDKRRIAWVLGAFSTLAMGFVVPLPVGGDPVMGPYFSQTYLSISILLLAMSRAIRGHILLSGILLGLGFDFNIMQSMLAGGIIAGLWLSHCLPQGRTGTKRLLSAGAVALLLATPSLAMTARSLLSGAAGSAWVGQELSDWARFWLTGHFFVDGRPPLHLLSMLSCLMLPVLALLAHRAGSSKWLPFAFAIPATLTLVQILLVGPAPSRILLQLHLFRSDVFAFSTAVAAAISLLAGLSWTKNRSAGIAGSLFGLLLVGSFVQALVASLALLAVVRRREGRLAALIWISAAACVAVAAWSMTSGMRTSGLILLVGLVGTFVPPGSRWRWVPLAALAVIAALVAQSTKAFLSNTWTRSSFAITSGEQSLHARQLTEFGASTPRDALFLVPPMTNARPFLHRGVWFSFYDGAAFLWQPGAEIETARRMAILGIEYSPGTKIDLAKFESQWLSGLCGGIPMAEKEGVTHVVLPDPQDASAPWTMHSPASALSTLGCKDGDPSAR